MDALGILETDKENSSASWDAVRPVQPGIAGAVSGVVSRNVPSKSTQIRVSELVDEKIRESVNVARRQVQRMRSSTSLAALAHALEASGDQAGATSEALEVLHSCAMVSDSHHADTFAIRSAIGILIRSGQVDRAAEYARKLPISDSLRLEIGAVLAGQRRFDEADEFIGAVDLPERESIEGYVLALRGQFQAATSHLRAALRQNPRDVDAALNLSISLLGLGARKKARAAAEQARRASPGRADVWLHLLELILAEGEIERAEREVKHILSQGVEATAGLLVVKARIALANNQVESAIGMLERASSLASKADDLESLAEIRSNLLRLRVDNGKLSRKEGFAQLQLLLAEFPQSEVVVVSIAQAAWRRHHSDLLRAAYQSIQGKLSASSSAFVAYTLATLEGENEVALREASRWAEADPCNDRAQAALLIALGIGQEKWHDAAELASKLLAKSQPSSATLNNAAYALAMAGQGAKAVALLKPHAEGNFILRATLGLAYLASGDIDAGMSLYRQAADEAESQGDDSRSLMTAYQALIVRQLELQKVSDSRILSALSLPPYPLPEDWQDRPEFLRLFSVARRHGYEWPLEV